MNFITVFYAIGIAVLSGTIGFIVGRIFEAERVRDAFVAGTIYRPGGEAGPDWTIHSAELPVFRGSELVTAALKNEEITACGQVLRVIKVGEVMNNAK